MTDLSPAAQTVVEAAWSAFWSKDAEAPQDAELIAAATLRAAADQMAAWADNDGKIELDDLLAIADELDPPSS